MSFRAGFSITSQIKILISEKSFRQQYQTKAQPVKAERFLNSLVVIENTGQLEYAPFGMTRGRFLVFVTRFKNQTISGRSAKQQKSL
ncbi:MAG: hypothetical protein WAM60_02665 [Candidatus Promineifilaceae bacterium]